MSNMTVQKTMPRCLEKTGQTNCGRVLVNGENKIERPVPHNLSFSQSWNGCIWQIQHRAKTTSILSHKSSVQNDCNQNGPKQNVPRARKFKEHVNNRSNSELAKSMDSPISKEFGDRPDSADRLTNDRLSIDRLSNRRHSNDALSNDRLDYDRLSRDRLGNDRHGNHRQSNDRLSNESLSNNGLSYDRPSNHGRHSNDRYSNDGLGTNDRLSSSSDKNRFSQNDDVDRLTATSSNFDSFGYEEEEYVLLDRSYVFPHLFRTQGLLHYSSMTDLKCNPLYTPKINNDGLVASKHAKSVPHYKPTGTLRNKSVNETDLDAVNQDGRRISWAKRSLTRIYENIGEVLKPKLGTTKVSFIKEILIDGDCVGFRNDEGSGVNHFVTSDNTLNSWISNHTNSNRIRERSKSLGELRLFGERDETVLEFPSDSNLGNENSDIDGDDFGFLSHSYIHSSPAMPKTKSSLASHRILPKRWRSKPRNTTADQCRWSPEGNCVWRNVTGQKIILKPISILQLSEAERLALQKIVLKKIQSFDLGCTVTVPKEHKESGRRRKHLLSIKRSKSANLSDLIHSIADRENDKGQHTSGFVFGISLKKCIANDMELQRKRNAGNGPLEEKKSSDVILHRQPNRKSSSSSQGSLEQCTHNGSFLEEGQKKNVSCESLSESGSNRNTSSSQIDVLALSDNRSNSYTQSSAPLNFTGQPEVPHIVKVCFQHIETYGLQVLGIFRIGSSKKRAKQLRDEFDSGRDVKLNESHNPHEVGSVLKEYFRDLPEPLLTRDLYSPFIATRGLSDVEKQTEVTRMLISLLPVANRDTLWALLQFLYKVKEHSIDTIDKYGQTLPGNKMDSHNLATLFGPNILHKTKIQEKGFTVENVERAGERKEVIDVVKALIDFHQIYFQLPAAVHDAILQMLLESDAGATEQILQRITAENGIEPDPDTSSSQFDESEESVANLVGSESNLLKTNFNNVALQPTLRSARSAEVLTPTFRRKCFYASEGEKQKELYRRKSDVNNVTERPKFHLIIESSPSPPEVRTPLQAHRAGISLDSSSSELTRPHSIHGERPHSELFCTPKTLSIPQPDFITPFDSCRSNKSPSRADNYGHSGCGIFKLGSSSNMTSSIQRPLNFNRTTLEGENEWQKHTWRQWDDVTAQKPNEGFEQETLV